MYPGAESGRPEPRPYPAGVERQAATLLKVRFADLSHLQNHLHVIEGRTLCSELARTTARHGDLPMMKWKVDGDWRSMSFRDYRKRVREASLGLRARGLKVGGSGLVLTGNRHEHVIACQAIVHAQGTPVSVYEAIAPAQLARNSQLIWTWDSRIGAMPLRAGGTVILKLAGVIPPFPTDLGRADVVRTDKNTGELAVRWVRSDPVVRASSLKLIDGVRRSWGQATEMTHAPPCCQKGRVLDPPMPALRGRL